MASPYLSILMKKLDSKSEDMRLYYKRVIHNVETLKAFNERENIAHIILAHSLDNMPVELTKTIPEQSFTTHLARYIYDEADTHSRLLYSSRFVLEPSAVAKEISDGFTAKVAEDMLQQYAMGLIDLKEPETFSFKWPFYSETEFPYEEKSEKETAQEAEILDRLESTLAKIQNEKDKS